MSHFNTIYNQILHPEINSGHQFERLEKPFRHPLCTFTVVQILREFEKTESGQAFS